MNTESSHVVFPTRGPHSPTYYPPSTDQIHTVHDDITKLMNLMDPMKHMRPGVAYDLYSGYILMVAKNVDIDEENIVNTGSNYGGRGGSQQQFIATTYLYGQLPPAAVREFQSSGIQQVCF